MAITFYLQLYSYSMKLDEIIIINIEPKGFLLPCHPFASINALAGPRLEN